MAATVFDPPERFVAGTVGPPGGRTFFLQASGEGRLVSVSLEKVQVSVLADRVNDLLDAHAEGAATEPDALGDTEPLATPIEDEFRVDTLALAWDTERSAVVIECHDADPEEAPEESLQTLRVVLAPHGRPGLRPSVRGRRLGRPPRLPVLRPAARPHRPHLPPCQRLPTLSVERLLARGELTPVGRLSDSSNGAAAVHRRRRRRRAPRHPQARAERAAPLGLPRRHPRGPGAGGLPHQRRRRLRRRAAHRPARRPARARRRCSCGSGRSRASPSRSSTSPRSTRCPRAGSSSCRGRPPRADRSSSRTPRSRPCAPSPSSTPSSTTPTARAATCCATATGSGAATTGSASSVEPKLRTVLWGWAGEEVPEADLARVEALHAGRSTATSPTSSHELLTVDEVDALTGRTAQPAAHPAAPAADPRLARHPVARDVARPATGPRVAHRRLAR